MKITIGFSPCPNDTFIFDALVNNKIDTEGLTFEAVLEDVQTLNNWAQQKRLDVSKISYGVLPLVLDDYTVLSSGGALGKGVGPLLIAKSATGFTEAAMSDLVIAIPGENTTAHFLFTLAFPRASKKRFVVFNEVEEKVLNGEVDAGVIIHENRFTYHDKGLVKLMDLGEFWETKTGLPIPLGGIIINKNIDNAIKLKVDSLICKSLEYAYERYPYLPDFVKKHSQEMSEAVMRKHIDLYVNNFTLSLGDDGKAAVKKLLQVFNCKITEDVFVT